MNTQKALHSLELADVNSKDGDFISFLHSHVTPLENFQTAVKEKKARKPQVEKKVTARFLADEKRKAELGNYLCSSLVEYSVKGPLMLYLTSPQLSAISGVSRCTVYKTLVKLEAEGRVARKGRRTQTLWFLTDKEYSKWNK